MSKKYSELLKDPRWQKKRLQIMERDEFKCQECGSEDTTLNVHHLNYSFNKSPWEHEDDELRTLCSDCHLSMHEDYQSIKKIASEFNGEILHYAVDILWKMQFLYPPDCLELLEHATELAKINSNG